AERARLTKMYTDAKEPSWFQHHGPKHATRTLVSHENSATEISAFHAMIVPCLLQTEEYARALLSKWNWPETQFEERVRARLDRAQLLDQYTPPLVTYYVHEMALRAPVGGPLVMYRQLRHLSTMSSRARVTVRILPLGVGAHVAMSGSFTLIDV